MIMKEREVQDSNKLTWKCVQAFTATNGEAAEEATRMTEKNQHVTVVCTPSGQAQSVRLNLSPDWDQQITDEQLLTEISNAQANAN
jgi:hypothetical protein